MTAHWSKLDDLIAADPVKGAALSAALENGQRLYRFALWRRWDSGLPLLAVVMLNPSTADAREDDATIRRLISFAKRAGYGGFIVVNIYAYRATEPRALLDVGLASAVGPENDEWILAACAGRDVLVAWGAFPGERGELVHGLIKRVALRVLCLGVTQAGHPRHPVRLSNDAALEPWPPEPATTAEAALA
jgi:hypothetical protein